MGGLLVPRMGWVWVRLHSLTKNRRCSALFASPRYQPIEFAVETERGA